MRIVAIGAPFISVSVDLPFFYVFPVMAKKAKVLRLGDQKKAVRRPVRVMAYGAAACNDRSMHLFLVKVQDVAILAEFLHRQNKLIAGSRHVARAAEFCSIGAVLPVLERTLFLSRCFRAGLVSHVIILFHRKRHPVKKET